MGRRLEDMAPREVHEVGQWFAVICTCTRCALLSPYRYGYSKAPTIGQMRLQLRCRESEERG
ncbi:MAG: hypothetical protein JWR00_288 [Rubritepida sp.]|nr:hypothetical protein [Rubritepida sp.]